MTLLWHQQGYQLNFLFESITRFPFCSLLLCSENGHSSFLRAFPHERSPFLNVANCPVLCAERKRSAILGNHLKVAHTSFRARGMDFQRASRVRNTHDKGARFKTQKTKTNMAARGFFCARSLLYRWPRNSLIKEASLHRKTCINSVYLRKTVSGIHCLQCFPNFKERTKDSQSRCKYGEWTYQQKLFGLFFFATLIFCNLYFVCSTNTAYAADRDDEKPNCVSRRQAQRLLCL